MEGDVRLVSGSSTVTLRAGTVQICINNTWGTICNPYYVGWDSREGGVVCRQLELQPLGNNNNNIIILYAFILESSTIKSIL